MSPRHRKTIVSCSLHNFLAFPPRTVACFSFLPSPLLCSGNPRKQKPNCRPVRGCKEARATNERALWFLVSSTLAPGAFRLQFSPNSGWLIADRRSGPSLRPELLLFGYLAIFALKLLPTRLSFTFYRLDIPRSSKSPPRDRHSAAFSIWNTEDTLWAIFDRSDARSSDDFIGGSKGQSVVLLSSLRRIVENRLCLAPFSLL